MPLNMNTVGTGTGVDGGSSTASSGFAYDTVDILKSKVSTVNMGTFPISGIPAFSNSRSYSTNQSYDLMYFSFPSFIYNNEMYTYFFTPPMNQGWSSSTKDLLYKMTISGNNRIYTQISIPFIRIWQVFTFRGILYLLVSKEYKYNYPLYIYKYDGSTFTQITDLLGSKMIASQHSSVQLIPMIYSNDDSMYFLCASADIDTYFSVSISLCKIAIDGTLSVLITADKVLSTNSMRVSSSAYTSIIENLLYTMVHTDGAAFGSMKNQLGLLCDKTSDGLYTVRLTHAFITNGDAISGLIGLDNYTILMTFNNSISSAGYYEITFTTEAHSTIDSVSATAAGTDSGIKNYRRFNSRLLPLAFDTPDTYICMLHRGYYASNSGSDFSNYNSSYRSCKPAFFLVNTSKEGSTYTKLTFDITEYSLARASLPDYCIIDMVHNPPSFQFIAKNSYSSSGYYYWEFFKYDLDASQMAYTSDGSRYLITVQLSSGDICYCNAGIESYTLSGKTVNLNDVVSFKIQASGLYTFTCKSYDAYVRPDFIIVSKYGSIMNLGEKYDKDTKTFSAYLKKGMTVNGTEITQNGYNKLTIDTPRIDIKM